MVLSQGVLEHADALTLDSPKTYLRPTVASASKSRTNNASHSHTKRGSAEARYGMSPAAKPVVRHKTPPKKQTPIERSPFKPLDLITRRQSLPPPCPSTPHGALGWCCTKARAWRACGRGVWGASCTPS